MRTRTLLVTVASGLIVASCGGGDPTGTASSGSDTAMDPGSATPPTVTPFHAIPDDSVGVTGTAACTFSDDGTTAEGRPGGFRVSCELEMSDPRVSGTEVSDRYRFYEPEDGVEADAMVWVAEEAVLTNEEGVWRGITQAADDTRPCGESHYVGEGDYAGLEFHYYFCDGVGDGPADLRGWISGGG